jgi:Kef-type K+ transport system membrane component KefB
MTENSSAATSPRLKRSVFLLILMAGIFDGIALVGTVALVIALANGDGTWPPVIAAAVSTVFLGLILLSISRRVAKSRQSSVP